MKTKSQKPIVIAIVGASGCGKTALAQYLQTNKNIHHIVSFTTRPMRDGEKDGVDHWFVSKENVPEFDSTIAYTEFGGAQYWTLPSQFENHDIMSYVIDEKGLIDLQNRWGNVFNIISVYVDRPNNPTEITRTQRDLERIPYHNYHCTVINAGTLQDYFLTATHKINKILKEL